MADEQLLTSAEAAELLRIGVETLRGWVRDGRVQTVQSPTRKLLFRREDLLAGLPKPVAAGRIEKLKGKLRKAREGAAKIEKQIGEIAAERNGLDDRRVVVMGRIDALQSERFSENGDVREGVERKLEKLSAEVTKLDERGRGLGATVKELSRAEMAAINPARTEPLPDLKVKYARLARWLEEAKDGEAGCGAMWDREKALDELAEAVAEAVNALAEAVRDNLLSEVAEHERRLDELGREVHPYVYNYPVKGPDALLAADKLLEAKK